MRQVLVTGAGGFVGSHLIPALLQAGYDVICCGRHPERLQMQFPGCRAVGCDMVWLKDSATWDALLRGVSVVINAAGIIQEHGANTFQAVHRDGPSTLFRAAERARVRLIIQISSLGADAAATTAYHRTKREADDFLRGLAVDWVVLQPSLVYGPGGRSQAFFAALAALPLVPCLGGDDQLIQPVHVDDLVEGILRLLRADSIDRITLAVVGPEPVRFSEFLRAIRRWLGLPVAPVLVVPFLLGRLAARIGDFRKWEFLNTDTLAMLCRGNIADAAQYSAATGIRPRHISMGLPQGGASRLEQVSASLYFAPPILRFSIALVWIGSGIVSLWGFPRETSEAWLLRVGIPGAWTALTLQAAAVLNVLLGLATLVRWHVSAVLSLQLLLIVAFTLILSVRMPEMWVHPFGPLLKNLPLFVATWMLLLLERKR